MNWDELLNKGIVRKTFPDKLLADSLIQESAKKLRTIRKIAIDSDSAGMIIVELYEALREICEAIAINKGFKIYTNEAITCFIKEILGEDLISAKFDRYRKIRNGADYYGESPEIGETQKASLEIPRLINDLEKYLR